MYNSLGRTPLAQGPIDQWHARRLAELSKMRITPPWLIRECFLTLCSAFVEWVFCTLAAEHATITAIPVSACGRTPCRRGRLLGHRGTRSRCCRRSSSRSRPSCLRAPPHHRTPGPSWALTRGLSERRRQRLRQRQRPQARGCRPSLGRELGRRLSRPPTPHQERRISEPNRGRTLERARRQALTPYHRRPPLNWLRNPPSKEEVA